LQTARGLLGEIHLWRADTELHPAEERLLHTFASQGAMALERAWLTQAETRAKVLEESDHLKSALLSSVSHELRSPLATIKASITSLRSSNVQWSSPAREDLLASVDDETDHLNRLVGNLLDMSRIESGALKPQRQWNLLSEIIGGIISRMRLTTEQHRLDVNLPEDLPLVPVDYVQMEQVFDNLISNSLKYAPPNTTIHISASKQEDGTLLVTVRNQGPHVPQEHLDRIFDKFYRVTDADRVTGTGLGLSICKGIIAAHGGRIWAENLPDGFAFNFTIPLTLDGTPPPSLPVESETI
jgi:two-component system sensor histidine kinase KdpD